MTGAGTAGALGSGGVVEEGGIVAACSGESRAGISVQLGKVAALHERGWNGEEGGIGAAPAVESIVGSEEEHLFVCERNLAANGCARTRSDVRWAWERERFVQARSW